MSAVADVQQTAPPSPPRLSAVLRDIGAGAGERVSLGDLVEGLKDRSFAPLMVLFAVPNVFLYLPGSSVLTGLPLMLLAVQLLAGRPSVWLPAALSARSIDRTTFARIVHHALPWVERGERLARPRLWPRSPLLVDRAIGALCFLMALILFLPIPFANGLPALAVIALGLALSERDGLWLTMGIVGASLATLFVAALVGGGVSAAAALLS